MSRVCMDSLEHADVAAGAVEKGAGPTAKRAPGTPGLSGHCHPGHMPKVTDCPGGRRLCYRSSEVPVHRQGGSLPSGLSLGLLEGNGGGHL